MNNTSLGARQQKKKLNPLSFLKSLPTGPGSTPRLDLREEKLALQNMTLTPKNVNVTSPKSRDSMMSASKPFFKFLLLPELVFDKHNGNRKEQSMAKNNIDYEQLIQQNKNLESQNSVLKKDIQRLEYLHRFLIEAHNNREETIRKLVEENRALRNSLDTLKEAATLQKPQEHLDPAPFMNLPIPYIRKPSGVSHIEQAIQHRHPIPPKKPDSSKFQLRSFTSKKERLYSDHAFNQSAMKENNSLNLTALKIESAVYDQSMSFLKFTDQKEAALVFLENDDRLVLQKLADQNEHFIKIIRSADDNTLLRFHTAIENVLGEGNYLLALGFRLKQLVSSCQNITSTLGLQKLFARLTEQICLCLGCERAKVYILDHNKEEFWTIPEEGFERIARIPKSNGVFGEVVRSRNTVVLHEAHEDKRNDKLIEGVENYVSNTILAVPIFDDNHKLLGICQATNKHDARKFTKDDEVLLSMLGTVAGAMITNSILYDKQKYFHGILEDILDMGVHLSALFGSREEILKKAGLKLQEIMNVKESRIYVIDKPTDALVGYDKEGNWASFPKDVGIAGHVFHNGLSEQILNPYNHELFNSRIDLDVSIPLLCWPIKVREKKEKIIGVMQVPNLKAFEGLPSGQNVKPDYHLVQALDFFSKQLAQTLLNNEKFVGSRLS